MRFNDYGINQICEQVKAKWPYLRVANSTTNTYDGSNFDNPLITIPLTSASVTDNVITLEYRLSVLDINGETVNMAGLAKEYAGTAVESCEYFEDILKDDLTQYKFVYKVNLLR